MTDIKTKTTQLSDTEYALPIVARGLWVEDASGSSLCECVTPTLAIALAKLLNLVLEKMNND